MKKVFDDADYFVALLNPKEQLHLHATIISRALGHVHIVTSEMVLAEVLNFYADAGSNLREAAASVVLKLSNDSNVRVIPQTSLQFHEAFGYYRQRRDKGWGLTGCTSFKIMQTENISEALSHDEHFQQAGFKALLRGPS